MAHPRHRGSAGTRSGNRRVPRHDGPPAAAERCEPWSLPGCSPYARGRSGSRRVRARPCGASSNASCWCRARDASQHASCSRSPLPSCRNDAPGGRCRAGYRTCGLENLLFKRRDRPHSRKPGEVFAIFRPSWIPPPYTKIRRAARSLTKLPMNGWAHVSSRAAPTDRSSRVKGAKPGPTSIPCSWIDPGAWRTRAVLSCTGEGHSDGAVMPVPLIRQMAAGARPNPVATAR